LQEKKKIEAQSTKKEAQSKKTSAHTRRPGFRLALDGKTLSTARKPKPDTKPEKAKQGGVGA
jgi:hypothetical protein